MPHQWQIFKPLKFGPPQLDTFHYGNHYHKDEGDTEDAEDGYKARVCSQVSPSRVMRKSCGSQKQKRYFSNYSANSPCIAHTCENNITGVAFRISLFYILYFICQ